MDLRVISIGLVVVLVVALGAVGASHQVLSQRLAGLEDKLQTLASVNGPSGGIEGRAPSSPAGSGRPDERAVRETARALREAQEDGKPITEEEALAIAETVLEDTFEEKAEERQAREVDKWMELAKQKMEVDLENFGDEHELSDTQVERATRLLVDVMDEGRVLRDDLAAGKIDMREAMAQGEELKADLAEELLEVLGEESYEALGVTFYGERGWEAAP